MNVCIVWLPPGSKNRTFHHSRRLFSLATFSTGTTPLTREPVLVSYSFASHFDRICINEISIWYLASFLSVTFVWLCDSVVFFFFCSIIYTSFIWIYQFIHSFVDGYLGCCQIFVLFLLWVKLLWKSPNTLFCWLVHPFLLCKFLGVELLGHGLLNFSFCDCWSQADLGVNSFCPETCVALGNLLCSPVKWALYASGSGLSEEDRHYSRCFKEKGI